MSREIGNREQPGYVCCAPPFISDRLMAGYKVHFSISVFSPNCEISLAIDMLYLEKRQKKFFRNLHFFH
ncbi:hypothetical protein T09_1159 [Trichinella sp. T9]|nr:hypothetical protein T09_1159 [Trichinella sp. T9]